MTVDVRPHNDVRRLFVSFGVAFLVVHQIVNTVVDFSSSSSSPSSSSSSSSSSHYSSIVADGGGGGSANDDAGTTTSCVETDENDLYCAEGDPKEARKRARRRALRFYLSNFGVRQTLDGSDDERIAMEDVVVGMEVYMRGWIVKHDHDEKAKEAWCVSVVRVIVRRRAAGSSLSFFAFTLVVSILPRRLPHAPAHPPDRRGGG